MRNLKTVIRNLNLQNTKVLGQISQRSVCTIPGNVQSVRNSRSFHNSSEFRGNNEKEEKRRNLIFFTILGTICGGMFLFSFTMKTHDDYVYVHPKPKEK